MLRKMAMLVALFLVLPFPVIAQQDEMIRPPGNTFQERIDFLKKLNADREKSDSKEAIRYYLGALEDPSPDVRRYGAIFIRDMKYMEKLINVMAADQDLRVRQSAAVKISSWITSNGTENCNSVDIVVKHLDKFLGALSDTSTSQHVIEVLGNGYAGYTPLPCCMPEKEKQMVINSLKSMLTSPPTGSITSYWSPGLVISALNNIAKCDE